MSPPKDSLVWNTQGITKKNWKRISRGGNYYRFKNYSEVISKREREGGGESTCSHQTYKSHIGGSETGRALVLIRHKSHIGGSETGRALVLIRHTWVTLSQLTSSSPLLISSSISPKSCGSDTALLTAAALLLEALCVTIIGNFCEPLTADVAPLVLPFTATSVSAFRSKNE